MSDDLRRRLEQMSERGTPRGATEILGAARATGSVVNGHSRRVVAIAVGTAALLVGGVATAVIGNGDDRQRTVAQPAPTSLPATTQPVPTTTAPSPPPTTVPKPPVAAPAVLAAVRLRSFSSCATLLGYAKQQALRVVGPYGLPSSSFVRTSGPTPVDATAGPSNSGTGSGSAAAQAAAPDYSTTNVQEAGVDEPDTVKTDGNVVFALAQGKLEAVTARGAPRLVGSLPVGTPRDMLLVGGRVIVFGDVPPAAPPPQQAQPQPGQPQPATSTAIAYNPRVAITVVDVADPSAMKVVSRVETDGTYVSSRLSAGLARIVIRSGPSGIAFSYPNDGSPEAQAKATEDNRNAVRNSTLDNWVPATTANGDPPKRAVDCARSYYTPKFAGFSMLTVLTLDAANPTTNTSTSVMADGNIVYASADHLYVATNEWGPITAQTVAPTADSLVHEFDISAPGAAVYLASGKVQGTVLNQFSMSELDGNLRIATTDPNSGSQSFVTVLGRNGPALVTMGKVGGLGKGERIYAVRFIGKLGYVVTFRQTDPLYTVDLSDPFHPRVVGELELTGFSAYLHPVGDGLLLGVGMDVGQQAGGEGASLSLFDVRDPAKPKLLQRKTIPSSYANVGADHHAFLWWPASNMAVLPVQEYSQGKSFTGAVGFTVTPFMIGEVGRVQHPSTNGQVWVIERSLVNGDRLLTVSQGGLMASALATLKDEAWVPFS